MAVWPMPWKTKVPKPPPPISAATVASPRFCTSTMRMPVRMTGKRQRQLDLRTGAGARDKPMPRAASTTAAGTWSSPTTVLATTGSSE